MQKQTKTFQLSFESSQAGITMEWLFKANSKHVWSSEQESTAQCAVL